MSRRRAIALGCLSKEEVYSPDVLEDIPQPVGRAVRQRCVLTLTFY